MTPSALITGIRGQDGAYLARFLLQRGYRVCGLDAPSSAGDWRLCELGIATDITMIPGGLDDAETLRRVVREASPREVYHLAARSSVGESFADPVRTIQVGALGTVQLLDAVRQHDDTIRFYQASSSEMFGSAAPAPHDETTPFLPSSPYAVAKVCAHQITRAYREAYGLFACNGILFNHESPLRDPRFVTRKITLAAAAIAAGRQDRIELGNTEAQRDFGYAPEYVEAMWRMLQQDSPDDYVVATGVAHSVREFAETAFRHAGLQLEDHLQIDEKLLRPADQAIVVGNASRAREHLGWEPRVGFDELVRLMVDADRRRLDGEPAA